MRRLGVRSLGQRRLLGSLLRLVVVSLLSLLSHLFLLVFRDCGLESLSQLFLVEVVAARLAIRLGLRLLGRRLLDHGLLRFDDRVLKFIVLEELVPVELGI